MTRPNGSPFASTIGDARCVLAESCHAADSDDDPDKANLQTAHNYNGQPLFTSDEKSQSQPTNCANAITQMNKGIGLSGGASQATFVKAMHPPGFTAIHHTDALAAIDALPSPKPDAPWIKSLVTATHPHPHPHPQREGSEIVVVRRSDDVFTDFWNWLKGAVQQAVAYITDIVVAVAEDVVIGIRMIVNGIEQVFKAVIKVVEDIAAAIGSFFQMLEKLIEDVIAALSVLLNFGEIIKTHQWLASQFQQQVSTLAATIKTSAKPAVDGFFTKGEDAIKGFFDQLRKDLGQNDQISNLKGSGATPHSAFTVGPKGGAATSHAPQCTWGMQKLKSGLPAATDSAGSVSPTQTAGDPLSDFFDAFIARLTGDGDLSGSFNQLKSDFGRLFNASSITQFFSTLMTVLLDIVETALIGALAVTNAFVDGFLALIDDVIGIVMSVLTTEIQIPVLTWLYEKVFGEKLTFLNVATLVAAIPVTLIFRVAEGQYPSAALRTVGALQASSPTVASRVAQKILMLFNAMFTLAQGIINALGDFNGDAAPPLIGKLSAGFGLIITAITVPAIFNASPSTTDWLIFGLGVAWSLAGVLALDKFKLANQAALPWVTMLMSLTLLAATVVAYIENGQRDPVANLAFAGGIIATLPGIANPLRLYKAGGPAVVAAIDVLGGIIVMALDIILAFASPTEPAPPNRHRVYFPWVAYSGGGQAAHP